MIIPIGPVRLNNKVFTRNSTAIRVNGVYRVTAVDTADWNDEKPHELIAAMNSGGVPLGKAEGNYACGATLGIYADAAPAFELAVLAGDPLAGTNLSKATFNLIITMAEDIRLSTAAIVGCNIVGRPTRTIGSDGAAIVKQYALQPLYIIEDGKSLVDLLPAL